MHTLRHWIFTSVVLVSATIAWAQATPNSAELIYGDRIVAAQTTHATNDDQALVDQMARAAAKTDDTDLQHDLAEIICTWALEKDLTIEPAIAPRLWMQLGEPDIDSVNALLAMLEASPDAPELAIARLEFLLAAADRLEAAGLWAESLTYLDAGQALLTDDMDDAFKTVYIARLRATKDIREQMVTITQAPTPRARLILAIQLAETHPEQILDWLDESIPQGDYDALALMAFEPADRTPRENRTLAEWCLLLADPDLNMGDELRIPLLNIARQYATDALAGCDPDSGLHATLTDLDAQAAQLLRDAGVADVPMLSPRVRPTWQRLRVHADRTWQPALEIRAGDEVAITATGKWHTFWGAGKDHIAGPEGHGDTPANRYGQLIARVGDGPQFDVLAGITFTADADGELQLACHDERRTDNAGYMTVTIQITPASE